jgi:glycolate oxidase FAD binding subunit
VSESFSGPEAQAEAASWLGALRDRLGAAVVFEHPAVEIDGCSLGVSLRPADGAALARMLAVLAELKLPAVVRGGGTRLAVGNPPRGARLLLSTEGLTGIDEFDPEDGVVKVAAGTRLTDVAREVNAAGWELPLEPAAEAGTVGGALASAGIGPRRLGFGPPRDCVLGLSVALPSGERTRCGGRVVKNVTGYDLAKLYTGSIGTLGVIESAWLRLRPLPESRRALLAELPAGDPDAFGLALEAARRTSARSVALVSPALMERVAPGSGAGREPAWLLAAEYAGEAPLVARDADWLEARLSRQGAVPESADAVVDRIGELQNTGDVRARMAVLPTRVEPMCTSLMTAGMAIVAHPGLALVYAFAAAADSGPALAAVDVAVSAGRADLLLEALPLASKRERDVFGDPGDRLALLGALKRSFDPDGILNPGRFQGRL